MNSSDLQRVLDVTEPLPSGEEVIWYGRPSCWRVALQVFHVRLVGLYFLATALWQAVAAYQVGGSGAALFAAAGIVPAAALTLGILTLLAWLTARTTAYVITTERLIMKIGIALSVTLNLPFGKIDSAAVRRFADGTGDLAILLRSGTRLGYAVLWPHARAWRISQPEPMLRAVPNADEVARMLSHAVCLSQSDVQAARQSPPVVQPAQTSTLVTIRRPAHQ